MADEFNCIPPLLGAGISRDDAHSLRRISRQLRRWRELECGVENGGVERDEATGKCTWYDSRTGRRSQCRDREAGALRRLAAVMARYPALGCYAQGDPRGAALYILRPDDIPPGGTCRTYYTRGLAVY